MKTVFTTAILFVGFAAFAQTAPTATASPAPTQTVQANTLTPKAKELCKEWTLSKTENFGDQHDPTADQKNDRLVLMENGRYRLIMNGVAEGGTWTLDKSNTWITLTTDTGVIKKFQILESSGTSMKIDYRDADDVHNILYYASGAAKPVPAGGQK
jgi:hypothetical protein